MLHCELTIRAGLTLLICMRLPVVLLCVGLLSACASRRRSDPSTSAGPIPPGGLVPVASTNAARTNREVIVTQGRSMTGRVASVNAPGRFVVLTFPLGSMPALEKRLNVYRRGLKVGELKVSGPQLDVNIDADIIAGECQPGDEVREE